MSDDLNEHSKVIMPLIRKVMPSLIASQIVGVQPMSSPMGEIWGMDTLYRRFQIISQYELDTGEIWYKVTVTNEIQAWLEETFNEGVDFRITESDYAIAVNIPDRVLVLLKLKWEK